MKLNKRKGFTVVELVIVIAIIAVLAAVLIPTFAGLVRKANISKDTQLVRNLNTALATATEKPKTMHEALQIAADAGYLVDKINASATSNEILYDSKNNVFCYYNATNPSEGSVEYIPESAQGSQINDPADYYLLWKIYDKDDDIPAAADQKFSVYLADDAKVPEGGILTVSVGFDAGTNTKVKGVNYTSDKKQTVVIRTYSDETVLTVDAKDANVTHYGDVGTVNIVRVAMASYHETGKVAGNINVAYGKVVVEATASVNSVVVMELKDSSDNTVTPDKTTIAVKVADSAKSGTKVVDTTDALENIEGVEKQKATVVKTLDELKAAKEEDGYIILGADITLDDEKNEGYKYIALNKNTTLNFGGHTITGQVRAAGAKGKTLILEGNGTIIFKENQKEKKDRTQSAVNAKYGTIIINGINIESNQLGIQAETKDGKIIVNEANINAQEHAIFCKYYGEVEVNGGTFTSYDNAVVGTNGSWDYAHNKITINGGTFNGYIDSEGYIACGIYFANSDTLTVNGGTFNIYNGTGILMRAGKTTIGKDVVINLYNDGKAETISGKVGDSSVTINIGTAIVIDYKSNYPGMTDDFKCDNNSAYKTTEINKKD